MGEDGSKFGGSTGPRLISNRPLPEFESGTADSGPITIWALNHICPLRKLLYE